ncbi:OmpA family protein [Chitinimonas sp. PSY-7]|uniref:OmpA family protein n=1 Tax=Chitinimonas sp. PSY-7 TaxID=3459088 RepID=UPI00403FF1A0
MKMLNPKFHLSILVGAALTACQSVPPLNPDLDLAKRRYTEASSDASVTQLAPSELERARLVLNQADQHWAKQRDKEEARHLSYLVQQRLQIAREAAASRQADNAVSQAAVERSRLLANARDNEAQQARALASDLENALAELSAQKTERGLVVTLNDVLFDVGSADLRPEGIIAVNKLASVMHSNLERRVRVEGYTDNTGPEAFNQTLSEQRAQAIKRALLLQSIASARIDTVGYGADNPVADNDSVLGRQQNRRVEIVVSDAHGLVKAN